MSRRRRRIPDLGPYAGKWVALSGERIIAVASSLPAVMRRAAARKTPRLPPSVFLVPRRDEGPYVLVIVRSWR